MSSLPPLIDNDAELAQLCMALGSSDCVAIDTEFVRDRTYYPKLCLLQLALSGQLYLVDPLADMNLEPLMAALQRPELVKILHAARQDLEIFYLQAGKVPSPVFDTQLAAACLGYGEQLSYTALVRQVLDIELGKSHARTDWARRPLSREQLRYAADDVEYLLPAYIKLNDRLQASNRSEWLAEAFRSLTDIALYQPQPQEAYQRIRGWRRLEPQQLARLARLAEWREELAMQKDLPRRWVVPDKPLLVMAALNGDDPGALGKIPGIPASVLQQESETLCAVLRAHPGEIPEFAAQRQLSAAENRLLKKLTDLVRREAETLETSPALLATREQLKALLRGDAAGEELVQGWRRDVIGTRLATLLAAEAR